MAWNHTSTPLQVPLLGHLASPSSSLPVVAALAVVLLTTYGILYYAQTVRLGKNEPPVIPSRIPFLGHVLGMLLQGGRYVKNLGLENPHLPIFTLPAPLSRIYIVTSPSLALSLQRLPLTSLSFTPLIPHVTKRVLGLNPHTVEVISRDMDPSPGQPVGFLAEMADLVRETLAPGETMTGLLSGMEKEFKTLIGGYVPEQKEIGLLVWIRHFVAVATARCFYGEGNPLTAAEEDGLEEAFWEFDHGLGGLLVGGGGGGGGLWSGWTAKRAYRGRERLVKAVERWLLEGGHEREDVPPVVKKRVEIALKHGWELKEVARSEVSFLFAGIVNTATTSFWGVLQVVNDGGLLGEVRRELGVDGGKEKIEGGLRDKVLLEAVVNECLRLGSDTYSTRVVVPKEGVEVEVKGKEYWFKGGAVVQISGGTIHASKENWGEDVREFKPERFLKGANYKNFRAFGGGQTLCPGRNFAVAVVRLLIAMVVTKFEIEVVGGRIPEKEDGVLPVHILEPKERVMVKVSVRDGREFGDFGVTDRTGR
ncbi:putative cytochrome P450 E-class, group IV [Cercophora samala]|uniref:Cytochrome P450 E-class, group IV n=1 Tax=Cercophora samala TaxID=330535 RepID=A0AA40DDN5_9PEZI|nr:putative cytochrome P450 E-class, group IV [Cercophora samala]